MMKGPEIELAKGNDFRKTHHDKSKTRSASPSSSKMRYHIKLRFAVNFPQFLFGKVNWVLLVPIDLFLY